MRILKGGKKSGASNFATNANLCQINPDMQPFIIFLLGKRKEHLTLIEIWKLDGTRRDCRHTLGELIRLHTKRVGISNAHSIPTNTTP